MTTLYQHPTYRRLSPQWSKWRDLYDGDHGTLTRPEYLWLHAIESKPRDPVARAVRSAREQRTRYLNLNEIIVSLWSSLIFKESIQFDQEAQALLDETGGLFDIDGQGTSFQDLAIRAFEHYALFGKSILLVDSFPISAGSRAEEQALGLRPFIDLIHPLAAPDWSKEDANPARLGKYNFFRHEFDLVLPRESSESEPKTARFSHTLQVSGGRYQIVIHSVGIDEAQEILPEFYDSKTRQIMWQPVGVVDTSLSDIPLSVIEGESWVKDVSEEALRYHNLRSTKDNVEFNQGYQKIFISGINGSDEQQVLALSEYTIPFIPENASVTVVPPVSTAELAASVEQSLANVFKVGLNQYRALPADSRAVQSAETQNAEQQNPIALVQSTIAQLEGHLNRALGFYAQLSGINNFSGKVELSKELDHEDWSEFLTTWQAMRDTLSRVPGAETAVAKKALQKLDFDEQTTAQLMAAADSASIATPTPQPQARQGGLLGAVINGRA